MSSKNILKRNENYVVCYVGVRILSLLFSNTVRSGESN